MTCHHKYEVTSPIDTVETCVICGDAQACDPIFLIPKFNNAEEEPSKEEE